MPNWENYIIHSYEYESEEEFNRSFNEFLANKKQKQEDMKKYPLFFWKEICEPILDLRKKKII